MTKKFPNVKIEFFPFKKFMPKNPFPDFQEWNSSVDDSGEGGGDGGIFSTPDLPPGDPKYASIFDLSADSPFATANEDKELTRLRGIIGQREKVISDLYKQIQETGAYGKIDSLNQKIEDLQITLANERSIRAINDVKVTEKISELESAVSSFKDKVANMEKNFKKNKINADTGHTEIEVGGGTRKIHLGED